MFNKGTKPPARQSGGVETLIGRQTEIVGDVHFTGGLHLDGRVRGNVSAAGDKSAQLSISESGAVEGEVRVSAIVLNGVVVGDVYSTDKISLGAKAKVTGNVFYKLLDMQSGAQINGQLVHESMAAAVLAARQAAFPPALDSQNPTTISSNEHRMIDVQEIPPHADGHPA